MFHETGKDTVVEAARNLILDYIRDNKRDSIALVVGYCDSVFSPDSSWLSQQERYLIRYFIPDTSALYDLDYYLNYHPVYDPEKLKKAPTRCYRPGHYYDEAVREKDNLTQVLKVAARRVTPENRQRYPRFEDVWEFYSLMDSLCPIPHFKSQSRLFPFKTRFPRSPFSRFKFIDREYWQRVNGRGMIADGGLNLFIGQMFSLFPPASRQILPNHFSTYLACELHVNQVVAGLYIDFAETHAANDVFNGTDTLPARWPVNLIYTGFDLGWRIPLGNNFCFTPKSGFFWFDTQRGVDSTGSKKVAYTAPRLNGLKLAVDADVFLGEMFSKVFNPAIRVSAGMTMADFQKISRGFRNIIFFTGISVGIINLRI